MNKADRGRLRWVFFFFLTTDGQSLNNDSEASYAELQRLQQQVASIQMAKTAGQLSDDQRLQALKNEHDRLMSDVEKLRRDNQEAFAQQLEIIVSCEFHLDGIALPFCFLCGHY